MKILTFGEILWDVFRNGEKVIGGAPFNFAAHMAKLGAESFLVSAVGADENGKEALEEAKKIGIKCDYIGVLRDYETGFCKVGLKNGKPSYELVLDTAYDHIPTPIIYSPFDALYMGTLALRSNFSKRSFEKLLEQVKRQGVKEIIFDVNFRMDFYSKELVNALLKETTVLKLSDEEIGFFSKKDMIQACVDLGKRYKNLKYICLTMGKEGATVYDCRKKTMYFSDTPKNKVVSTVGAGDSFAAAFLFHLLYGFKPV